MALKLNEVEMDSRCCKGLAISEPERDFMGRFNPTKIYNSIMALEIFSRDELLTLLIKYEDHFYKPFIEIYKKRRNGSSQNF